MTTHRLEPSRYYTTMGWHPPVLHVADGDTVRTTTVDARGRDATDQGVTEPGNPQTGPIFVEGAEPGDSIAVHFDRIRPNRRRGWTRAALAANVVDPEYVPELPPGGLVDWDVDVASGKATLRAPDTKLDGYALKIDPMLGCFGVAPSRGQAISTGTSSTHGGNMDYRGFRQGVTVFFPVFAPGALLFVGDCHAVQGDGEIVGTGIEISADVELTVRLRKGQTIQWPRAEDETFIMTVGNARPLDQALQHATTEMARWLQADHGLDPRGAQILLGQTVRYEIGNVYDPAYTVVCKMEKSLLPR